MLLEEVKDYLCSLQDGIVKQVELLDGGAKFHEDKWDRQEGGGGSSRVLSNGHIFEQAGVNFSHVMGKGLPPSATAARPELAGRSFEAMGVSLVFHPRNPFVPTTHMNVRLFVASKKDAPDVWWFGGGYDLTPYYAFEEDCVFWHQTAKAALDKVDTKFYPKFKEWADSYFYLKHREEARGIGGTFFDDLNESDFETCFRVMKATGNSFMQAYQPIVERRSQTEYTQAHKDFQLYRRGRYVEFNLLYDRGTIFGLQSGGRTESILMSLPPIVNWRYDWSPEQGTAERELYDRFLVPQDWISQGSSSVLERAQ